MTPSSIKLDEVPALSGGANLAGLKIGPQEGFVLSRIDGRTDVKGICQVSGLPEAETLSILERLREAGVISVSRKSGKQIIRGRKADSDAEEGEAAPAAEEAPEKAEGGNLEESFFADDGVDVIDRNLKVQTLRLLDIAETDDYYDLLGVSREAEVKEIRQAYRVLSQQYHPDNFYGAELGPWEKRLELVFMAIVEAFDVLRDKEKRWEYDRRLKSKKKTGPGKAASAKVPAPKAAGGTREAPAAPVGEMAEGDEEGADGGAYSQVESLRQRAYGKIKENVKRGRELFEKGLVDMDEGDFLAAAQNFKLAMSFDPFNKEYQKRYEQVESSVNVYRADKIYKRGLRFLENDELDEAVAHFEEAVNLNPKRGRFQHSLAEALYKKNAGRGRPLDRARLACDKALELDPRNVETLILSGFINKEMGDKEAARRDFKAVVKIDRRNKIAAQALKEL